LAEREEYEKAIDHYLKGAEVRPAYFSCHYGLADCYFRLQQYDKAKEYLLLLLDGLPENGNDRESSLREKASELLKKLPES
jgi:tetratricopeptide (TPR) repeat protein